MKELKTIVIETENGDTTDLNVGEHIPLYSLNRMHGTITSIRVE